MRRTGTATTPLHGGHCPPWLFNQMRQLSGAIIEAIILEYGTEEVLRRFSDPVWFQAFGSVLGFDWHSSGLTTVVLGAFKESWTERSGEYGLFVAGGKGKSSRKTPEEIDRACSQHALSIDGSALIQASRLSAKVDSGLVQDGYDLYHHVFLFNRESQWTVIQQGMNADNHLARRYHWLSTKVNDFTLSPHEGIIGYPEQHVLDLTSPDRKPIHAHSLELIQNPEMTLATLRTLYEHADGSRHLTMPRNHLVPQPAYFNKILYKVYETPPEQYQSLVAFPGIGKSTLRALAMVAEIIYGTPLTYHDPIRYSFAHGGKDGTPFPVHRPDYETTISSLELAIQRAHLGETEKMKAFRRLSNIARPSIS